MKFVNYSFILVFLLCFILLCCAPPKKEELDLTQIRKVIEENGRKFIEASLQGDAAAVAALCTEDTFLLAPNNEMIQGRQETEAFWEAAWSQMRVVDFDTVMVDLYGSGDVVYEIGNYTVKFQIEGQEPLEEKGKYVSVWRHMADGSWKRQIDIWNSSMLAQP